MNWIKSTFSNPAEFQLKSFVFHLIMHNVDSVGGKNKQLKEAHC